MGVEQLTDSLYRLLLGRFQAYLWREAGGLTLIDTGAADAGADIAGALDELGLEPSAIDRVVLTHFHDDHVGAAAEVRQWGDVEVVAHASDAPIIRGDVPGPPPTFVDDELSLREHVVAGVPPAPPVAVDVEVTDGDVLDFGGGAHVVAAPGHTAGSIALHLPAHGVLFTGDTVAEHMGRVLPGVFNLDGAQTAQSMRRLAGLGAEIAAVGHGQPLLHDAAARLRAAVAALG